MKRILFLIYILFPIMGCTEDEEIQVTAEAADLELLPDNKANDVLNAKLFDVINLDYPGLEKVKAHYEANEYYYAAYELLKYYRNRSEITNPNINLMAPSITAFDQNVADQALEYRFYVRNFKESADEASTETYYSLLKDNKIDWSYIPSEITDQEYGSQLHRHQWMLPQAKAYRVTQDEKYVTSWIEVYGDWLATFPCPEGKVTSKDVQWYALQPACRVLDQVDIMPYFIQSANFTPEWLSTFLTALAGSVECIRNNYYYTEESNIYVTQVQAVITAAMLMPEFRNASTWLSEAAQKVSDQVTGQFLEDGVQIELDPSYHIGVVDNFYTIYKLAQVNDKLSLFPDDYIESLKKAARFVMDIIYPNYSIDNFNDTRSSSYTKSVILKNLKKYMEMFPEDDEIRWMATEGKQGTEPTGLVQLYDASGYYMLRSGWKSDATMMVLKNNKNINNRWHCQPDNGTFGLYRNGRNFCPDAGVYSYGGTASSNSDRVAYAATAQHNTLTRNKKDIAEGYMNGQLLLQKSEGNVDILVTENQSYADLAHRRAVFFVDKTFFVLVDEGYGEGSTPTVNLTFKLCPTKNEVVIDDTYRELQYGAHTLFADGNNMLFKTFSETGTDFAGTNNTSYISEKLGEKTYQRRFYQVNVTKPENGAARFITVIYPFRTEEDFNGITIDARFTDNGEGEEGTFHENGAAVEVIINGETYKLSYTL